MREILGHRIREKKEKTILPASVKTQFREKNYSDPKFAFADPNQLRPGAPTPDDRIVGGFAINITQVPWQAAILLNGVPKCSGSIISNRWILTSTQCVWRLHTPLVRIRAGSADGMLGGQLRKVADVRFHQSYKPIHLFVDYDYALLELDAELTFDDRVRPIELAAAEHGDIDDGTTLLVSGWGETNDNAISQRYLRGIEVPKMSHDKCNAAYGKKITPRIFCGDTFSGGSTNNCTWNDCTAKFRPESLSFFSFRWGSVSR